MRDDPDGRAGRGEAATGGWTLLGDRAVRIARPPAVAPRALANAVRAWPGVIDVVVAREDLGVYFADTPQIDPARIAALATLEVRDETTRDVELHAHYDGVDLDEIARAIDATTADVIGLHRGATYVVEMIGFAPGFAYLVGLDARLAAIPRRASPRPRVPAGSLAIAGGFTAVYPFDSPGGWNLIGRVDERMFDDRGARLQLGDRVRFT